MENIKLRRSEKKVRTAAAAAPLAVAPRFTSMSPSSTLPAKVLNEVNKSERSRHPLMNPSKPGKLLERVATGADKIHVLVRRLPLKGP